MRTEIWSRFHGRQARLRAPSGETRVSLLVPLRRMAMSAAAAVVLIGSGTAQAATDPVGGDWVLPIDRETVLFPTSVSDDARWVFRGSQSTGQLSWTSPGAQTVHSLFGFPDMYIDPVMGFNGDIIADTHDGDGCCLTGNDHLRAIKSDGTLRYNLPLPDLRIESMATGNDGDTYVLAWSTTQSPGENAQVLRISPNGDIRWRHDGLPSYARLSATTDGVSLVGERELGDHTEGVAMIVRSDGSATVRTNLPHPADCPLYVDDIESNQLGDTFIARRPSPNVRNSCRTMYISRLSADGSVAWTVDRPWAGGATQLSALPSGDVLVINDTRDSGYLLGRTHGATLAADQWPGDTQNTLYVSLAGTDRLGATFYVVAQHHQTCPGAPLNYSCVVIELRRRSPDGALQTLSTRVPQVGTFLFSVNATQLMPGWVVYHEYESHYPESADRLVGFAVPSSPGPYRPYTTCQQRGDCPIEPPPATTPPPVGLPPPKPPSDPLAVCRKQGSLGARIVASVQCGVAKQVLTAKCGYAVFKFIGYPLKAFAFAKTAKGFYDLGRVPNKRFSSFLRFYNKLLLTPFSKSAPKGARNADEVIDRLNDADKAADLFVILPQLEQAVSSEDYEELVRLLLDVVELKPCADGLEAVVES